MNFQIKTSHKIQLTHECHDKHAFEGTFERMISKIPFWGWIIVKSTLKKEEPFNRCTWNSILLPNRSPRSPRSLINF